jgi:hypothetical protein
MANADTPFGFRNISNEAGTASRIHEYSVAASTTIYPGTPVAINSTGQVIVYNPTATNVTMFPRCIGVAAHYRAGTDTSRILAVYDHPDAEFEVQVDDDSVSTVGDLVGQNFTGLNVASGNTTKLQSIAEIDGSTGAVTNITTTPRPYKGLRFSSMPGQTNSTSYPKIVVKINAKNHLFASQEAVDGA